MPQSQTAFEFTVSPQVDGKREKWADRLQQAGMMSYWDVYTQLLNSPPDWESGQWQQHPRRKAHWPRKALYIAWAASPADARSPKTLTEFANIIGIRRTSIYNWHVKSPELSTLINEMMLAPLENSLSMVDFVTIQQATDLEGTVTARRLFYDRRIEARTEKADGGGYQTSPMEAKSDDELRAEAERLGAILEVIDG